MVAVRRFVLKTTGSPAKTGIPGGILEGVSTATVVPATHELEGDAAIETLRRSGLVQLSYDSFARFRAADGFSHARGLAFQLTLSALPALIAAVGTATRMDQEGFSRVFQDTLLGLAPGPPSRTLSEAFRHGSQAVADSTSAILLGAVAAVIAATGAMGQVERGANRIYGIERDRPFMRKYATALLLACSAGMCVFFAFILFIGGAAIRESGAAHAGWSDAAVTAWSIVRWPLAVAFVVLGFSLLFRYAPRRRQPSPSWLAVGAAVTTGLWIAFTAILAFYLQESREFGETYGSLAGMVGMLLWSFATSVSVFLGLAFAAQLEAIRADTPEPATAEATN